MFTFKYLFKIIKENDVFINMDRLIFQINFYVKYA